MVGLEQGDEEVGGIVYRSQAENSYTMKTIYNYYVVPIHHTYVPLIKYTFLQLAIDSDTPMVSSTSARK